MTIHDFGVLALRQLDPETARGLSVKALKLGIGLDLPRHDDPILATSIGGLELPNCVGLAAGFDKNAEVPDKLLKLGFGFVECGTVTPLPQTGNERPRLFRLKEDQAVINRMGFNNDGVEAIAGRLAEHDRRRGIVGANIGANKDSADRVGDYIICLTRLWTLADYFTVNISSPNTPGLRVLQTRAALEDLLGRLSEARQRLSDAHGPRPVFLKVAPDLDEAEVSEIVEASISGQVDAIIVSNTTVSRPLGLRSPLARQTGGLSGAPLFELSTQVLRIFDQAASGRIPLIGVGGISSGADAYEKIRAGATAIQFYTALSIHGATLVGEIKRDLAKRLRADGFASVAEAVGKA